MAGKQQKERHGHDFIRADLSTVILDPHDFGDQPLTTLLANGLRCRSIYRFIAKMFGIMAGIRARQ